MISLSICLPIRMSTYGGQHYSYSPVILRVLHRIWYIVEVQYFGQIDASQINTVT